VSVNFASVDRHRPRQAWTIRPSGNIDLPRGSYNAVLSCRFCQQTKKATATFTVVPLASVNASLKEAGSRDDQIRRWLPGCGCENPLDYAAN